MAKRKRARSERRRVARAKQAEASAVATESPADPVATDQTSSVATEVKPAPAKQSAARAKKARAKKRSKPGRGLPIATIGWSIAGLAVLGLLGFVIATQGGARAADAATEQLARENAGSDVTVYSGRAHVVYQSDAPLPSSVVPQIEGRPTLVWFSAVWCPICERMAPFAHEKASEYTDRLVFVEKSIDEDRESSNRYGVRGTPTFIMLDATGREVTRFHGQADALSFGFAIEQALAALEG